MGFDSSVRRQFPFVGLRPGVAYLDAAATAQMPEAAIAAMDDAARRGLGNPHRGLHPLADDATTSYENARATVAGFVGAKPHELVFTKNATEALNLAAASLGERWGENDAVAVTRLDHHANILPWLALKERRGVEIRWIGANADGSLNDADIETTFRDERVRLLAVTGQSNVLGTQPDVKTLVARAKEHHALTCVDAAQLAAHAPIDVADLGCDLLAFSGHKTYGPTGVGALYARAELLQSMPPFQSGGGMVRRVTDDGFVPVDAPARFEAGTPPLLPAIGWAAALEWQKNIPWDDRVEHEKKMLALLLDELRSVPGVTILGPAYAKVSAGGPGDASVSGCVSFAIDGVHPHDAAEVLGGKGVCVRAGHHCAQPLHESLGIDASVRASVGLYTNEDDIRALKPAIEAARKLLLR